MNPRGLPKRSIPAPCRITPPHSEPDTISSDSMDDLFRIQLSQVNQCLDKFQREFQKSRGEMGEGSSGRSPFTQEIQDNLYPSTSGYRH